jgi:inosose dehydratase
LQESAPARRLAGAPISWGICEVPGWGRQLPAERVLGEMASLGLHATELGAIGYLPLEPAALRARLDEFGLRLVAGFVPLVLHEPELGPTRERASQMAELLAGAGAEVFIGAILADEDWGPPRPLQDAEWERLVGRLADVEELVAGHGLRLAVHPHVGTLIERDAEVQRLLADSAVGWCLDTGHMLIGGTDAVDFVRRHGERVARRACARRGLVARSSDAAGALPAPGEGRRADPGGAPRARRRGVRALARARAGHRHHRAGAAGW